MEKVGLNLHLKDGHPLFIVKSLIEDYCNNYASTHSQSKFSIFDKEIPIVSVKSCFDDLLVLPDHPSRRPTDTYYVNSDTVR